MQCQGEEAALSEVINLLHPARIYAWLSLLNVGGRNHFDVIPQGASAQALSDGAGVFMFLPAGGVGWG